MDFYFDSFSEFVTMNGHGPYVWICYFVTFVVLASLLLMPILKSRKFIQQQRRLARREAAIENSEGG